MFILFVYFASWVDAFEFEFEFDDGGESGETPCFKTTTWESSRVAEKDDVFFLSCY